MRRSRSGDAGAFEELVHRWQGPVARLVGHFLGPTADVDDLCQEVFLRVLRNCERYEESHAFSTWVYRIALNVARDTRRHERRRPREPLAAHDVPAMAASPEQNIERGETSEAVAAAIATLPEALREILVLKHFGKLTFAEVAATTGVPLGTVKSRMQSALNQLRGELRRRGISDAE